MKESVHKMGLVGYGVRRRLALALALAMKTISLALLLSVSAVAWGSEITLSYTAAGIQSVTLPACTATIECWGAGGNGAWGQGGGSGTCGGGGGGGGGFSEWNGTLDAGTYYFQVGTPGGTQGSSSVGTADTVWDWNGSTGGKQAWATGGATSAPNDGFGGAGYFSAAGGAGGVDKNGLYLSGGDGGDGYTGPATNQWYSGGGGGGTAGPGAGTPDYPGIAGDDGENATGPAAGMSTIGLGGMGYSSGGNGSYLDGFAGKASSPGGGGGANGNPSSGGYGELVVSYNAVPEPGTFTLLVSALLGLAVIYRRRRGRLVSCN